MKVNHSDIERLERNPLDLFYDGCRSPATKERYARYLRAILCDIYETVLEGTFEQRVNVFVKKAKSDPDWTINLLLALSKKLRERTALPKQDPDYLNPTSFGNYFKPLKKLLDMNGVPVVWKRIYATFPEQDNNSEGSGYTREEIAQILEFAKGSMDKAIILIASSSGIRVGGMMLKWQDVMPVYKVDDDILLEITESQEKNAKVICGILKIYQGTSSFYSACITPEAYNALQNWRKTWIMEIGREPKPTEPIFKREGVDLPIMLEPTAIKARIEKVLKKSGFRTTLTKDKRRHEIPVMNGFRRFFAKVNKNTVSKDSPLGALIKKENMMGHTGLIKLDKNYFKTHVLELVEEYLNAVPYLTIDDSQRKSLEIESLKKRGTELENEIYKNKTLEKKVDILNKRMEALDKIASSYLFRIVDSNKKNLSKEALRAIEEARNSIQKTANK